MKKMFVKGFVLGAIIFGSIGALAATSFTALTASFPILINGKVWSTDKPVVVIEGSTYLPLRAIGEVLGVNVNWNESLRQVEIGGGSNKVDPITTITNTTTEVKSTNGQDGILEVLSNDNWIKQNVSLKTNCYGKPLTGAQVITYEIINDDLALVKAEARGDDVDENSNLGVQVFLLYYNNGKVNVSALPSTPAYPDRVDYGVDSGRLVLVERSVQGNELNYTAYSIESGTFKSIDKLSQDFDNYDPAAVDEFDAKYVTHGINLTLNNATSHTY